MYRPVMMVFIDERTWERFEADNLAIDPTTDNLLSRSVACSNITLEVYHRTADIDPENDFACRFFYFDVLSFTGKGIFKWMLL